MDDGTVLALGLDAATFVLARVAPLFLFIPSPKRTDLHMAAGEKKSLWADAGAGAILAVWCLAGLFNPHLRRVEDREWFEAQALRNAAAAG